MSDTEDALSQVLWSILGNNSGHVLAKHPLRGLILTDGASGALIVSDEIREQAREAVLRHGGTIQGVVTPLDAKSRTWGKYTVQIATIPRCAICPGVGDAKGTCTLIMFGGEILQLSSRGLDTSSPRHVLGLVTLEDLQNDEMGR